MHIVLKSAHNLHVPTCVCIQALALCRPKTHRPGKRIDQLHLFVLKVPSQARDQEIVNAAKNIMFSSAQKLQLTELSGRRDMSLLLAQSAVQVRVLLIAMHELMQKDTMPSM